MNQGGLVIKYNLICKNEHEFEAWFSKGSDFDLQSKKGLISCPHCATTHVEKAIMAPAISTSRKKQAMRETQAKSQRLMNSIVDKIRREIAEKCENVGDNFADEARSIHYGESPERGIYVQTTPQEASDLREEGIEVAPLPEALMPKTDLN